jgi:hypothetical protein
MKLAGRGRGKAISSPQQAALPSLNTLTSSPVRRARSPAMSASRHSCFCAAGAATSARLSAMLVGMATPISVSRGRNRSGSAASTSSIMATISSTMVVASGKT